MAIDLLSKDILLNYNSIFGKEAKNLVQTRPETTFRVFSTHFGNLTRPLVLGIFCVVLYKIGKNSHHLIYSNKTKHKIFGSLISTFQHLECKNTICCCTVQLRCHKMVFELRILSLKLEKSILFAPISVIKMGQLIKM